MHSVPDLGCIMARPSWIRGMRSSSARAGLGKRSSFHFQKGGSGGALFLCQATFVRESEHLFFRIVRDSLALFFYHTKIRFLENGSPVVPITRAAQLKGSQESAVDSRNPPGVCRMSVHESNQTSGPTLLHQAVAAGMAGNRGQGGMGQAVRTIVIRIRVHPHAPSCQPLG